ncbi:MAG TPA: hypothetical protein VFC07_12465 [Verrucomicrobiae bacterium]|nr:hypothetical protein [Verrucomicrobiae bacterium]
MNTRHFIQFLPPGRMLAAVLLAGLICTGAWGQTNSARGRGGAVPVPAVGTAEEARFDLEVTGGHVAIGGPGVPVMPATAATVGNLVQALQKAVPGINILESKGVSDVPLIDFKLHDVTAGTVLSIISRLTESQVRLSGGPGVRMGGRGGGGGFGPNFNQGSEEIYMLDLIPEMSGGVYALRQVQVFNINGFLGYLSGHGVKDKQAISRELSDIMKTITDTVAKVERTSVLTPEQRPDFEFHEGTGLLIVVGTPNVTDVATKIINALPGQQADQPNSDLAPSLGSKEPQPQPLPKPSPPASQ